MNDLYSVILILKRFGIYVYAGNRKDDITLMQMEVKDLYDSDLLLKEEYLKAVLILRQELSKYT